MCNRKYWLTKVTVSVCRASHSHRVRPAADLLHLRSGHAAPEFTQSGEVWRVLTAPVSLACAGAGGGAAAAAAAGVRVQRAQLHPLARLGHRRGGLLLPGAPLTPTISMAIYH